LFCYFETFLVTHRRGQKRYSGKRKLLK